MDKLIVSRHKAAIQFVARYLDGRVEPDGGSVLVVEKWLDDSTGDYHFPETGVEMPREYVPVIANATADDVRGKIVYGNVPLHLACLAELVVAIEFSGDAPRGMEYTLEQMDAAGAKLVRYQVTKKE